MASLESSVCLLRLLASLRLTRSDRAACSDLSWGGCSYLDRLFAFLPGFASVSDPLDTCVPGFIPAPLQYRPPLDLKSLCLMAHLFPSPRYLFWGFFLQCLPPIAPGPPSADSCVQVGLGFLLVMAVLSLTALWTEVCSALSLSFHLPPEMCPMLTPVGDAHLCPPKAHGLPPALTPLAWYPWSHGPHFLRSL